MHIRIDRRLTDGFRTNLLASRGKKRLAGDTAREATSDESRLRPASLTLDEVLIENRPLKKMSVEGRTNSE